VNVTSPRASHCIANNPRTVQRSAPTHASQYGYKHFLEQVNLAEQLISSDFGISTGLINQNYWENSKWSYVNVERGNAADNPHLNGCNVNVSFTNNSNVPIEVMVFIFYSYEISIDVKTGLVTRHKN
jgi:hypothetical protein